MPARARITATPYLLRDAGSERRGEEMAGSSVLPGRKLATAALYRVHGKRKPKLLPLHGCRTTPSAVGAQC